MPQTETRYRVYDPRLDEPHTTTDTERAARLSRAGLRVTAATGEVDA